MMLTCYWDFARNIPGFDMVIGLQAFEQERLRRGADKVQIEMLPGPRDGFRSGSLWPPAAADRRTLRSKIMLPMCAMLRSCARVVVHDDGDRPSPAVNSFGHGKVLLRMQTFLSAYAQGIRPLRPAFDLAPNDQLITITLREADHWPIRNSNLAEWRKAAIDLSLMGFDVVIVRDTQKANEPLGGVSTSPKAARDLEARAQLYRSSALNMFVSNGPAWFALALDAPVLMFRPATNGAGKLAGYAAMAAAGLQKGAQLPNAPAYHRLIWNDERADCIVSEAARFMAMMEKNNGSRLYQGRSDNSHGNPSQLIVEL